MLQVQTPSICVNSKNLAFETPKIMGIINLTKDSFYEESRVEAEVELLYLVERMLASGVDIIDLGATSTRPGAKMSSASDELHIIINAVKAILGSFPDTLISVDTYHAEVAIAAIDAGAAMVNDISGGAFDPEMFHTVAQLKVPYVLMHIQGTPETMQQEPKYEDVVADVMKYFSEKINQLYALGVNDIILDLGFGFGKTLQHNYQLFAALEQFKVFNLPLLVGVSRKSMVNKVLNVKPEQALNGSTVLHTLALWKGANILRVHDVKEAKEAIDIVNFAKQNQ